MVTMHHGIDVKKFHFMPAAREAERRALGYVDRKLLPVQAPPSAD
jgi:hypothetical protein